MKGLAAAKLAEVGSGKNSPLVATAVPMGFAMVLTGLTAGVEVETKYTFEFAATPEVPWNEGNQTMYPEASVLVVGALKVARWRSAIDPRVELPAKKVTGPSQGSATNAAYSATRLVVRCRTERGMFFTLDLRVREDRITALDFLTEFFIANITIEIAAHCTADIHLAE